MNPVLEEVYSTVITAAPFVLAAYVLVWVALFVFVVVMLRGTNKTQKDIDALRSSIERRERERAEK